MALLTGRVIDVRVSMKETVDAWSCVSSLFFALDLIHQRFSCSIRALIGVREVMVVILRASVLMCGLRDLG